ncbi:unnamed protein product [Lactuca virosa]|uniref:Uncharacterized protein n=1 Tax=Lactuca virosa TaxID=75947 RepID=A0AAU9NET4_9ASTR|nr:unnamed protein product [Lactuca virosa]
MSSNPNELGRINKDVLIPVVRIGAGVGGFQSWDDDDVNDRFSLQLRRSRFHPKVRLQFQVPEVDEKFKELLDKDLDITLAGVHKEKKLSFIKAWEENKKSKIVIDSEDLKVNYSYKMYNKELFPKTSSQHLLKLVSTAITGRCSIRSNSRFTWVKVADTIDKMQIKFMDNLLQNGFEIDVVDKDGATPLHYAI